MKTVEYNPTVMIKCKFSNIVHKLVDTNYGNKRSEAWKNKKTLTNEEKVKLFDEIVKNHAECSKELAHFQYERREKRRVDAKRVENGYYEKKAEKKLKNDLVNSK